MKLAAGKIIMADDASLESYDPSKYASIASHIVKENDIQTILLGATLSWFNRNSTFIFFCCLCKV